MFNSQQKSINISISRAINFLHHNQLPSGGFPNYISFDKGMKKDCKMESCIFSSTIIAYCIAFAKNDKVVHVVEKTKDFLINEMVSPGIWRYFSSNSDSNILPDIDDTCCASFLLRDCHPSIVSGGNISIISNNMNKDGLFHTWIDPFSQSANKNDIDSVVNANVVLYLGEREETKCAINYLNKIIIEDIVENTYWYYLNNISLYYMISRAYFHGVEGLYQSAEVIIDKIISVQKNNGSFGDELMTALAVSTLLNLNYNDLSILTKGISFLLNTQNEDGWWQKIAFYAGPPFPIPHLCWYGAEVLTTAMCVEALAKLNRLMVI